MIDSPKDHHFSPATQQVSCVYGIFLRFTKFRLNWHCCWIIDGKCCVWVIGGGWIALFSSFSILNYLIQSLKLCFGSIVLGDDFAVILICHHHG